MLYLECADGAQWERAMERLHELMPLAFSMRPAWPLGESARVVEVSLVRTAKVALVHAGGEEPTAASLEACALDGWQATGSDRVVLLDGALLRIVDGDKQPGRSQALISDMFTAMTLGARAGAAAGADRAGAQAAGARSARPRVAVSVPAAAAAAEARLLCRS